MNLSPSALMASLLVSSIGFVLFVYGRKIGRLPQLVGGLALMVFPYFVSSPGLTLGIGGGVLALVALIVRLGW
ncbi:MAG TPA: amino acid transport protein [Polyangia bacterium]|nr:amino acid transport protein [Polyangia bacterium]